jgi:hypothetical protein
VTLIASNAPGNVFMPREPVRLRFQVERIDPARGQAWPEQAAVRVVRYAMRGVPGDNWWPRLDPLERYPAQPIELAIDDDAAWADLDLDLDLPETLGGYGVVVDLGPLGTHFLTSVVRTFDHDLQRVQHPKQALDPLPADVLARLGVQALRYGVQFRPEGTSGHDDYMHRLRDELTAMHGHKLTAVIEFGVGSLSEMQPMGRGRPHLTDDGRLKNGKQDLVWLPEHDDTYEQYVYDIVAEFGWPKGPVTGVMLWNEPWQGSSISGWQADIPRYRELYRRTGDAVFRAREQAGVDVLIGGCDSDSNTWDNLFSEGLDESPMWPAYLDFLSMHY